MSRIKLFIIALALIVALVGCGSIGEKNTGSIAVSFQAAQAKSIVPGLDLICAEYSVSATGPSGAVIAPQVVTATTVFKGLVPGAWTINVVGRNAGHVPIAAGSGNTVIAIGVDSILTITVTEYDSPNGSLLMNIQWEPSCVQFPAIVGNLHDVASVDTPQTFDINLAACTATNTTSDLHPGWYAETVQLFDAREGLNGTEILASGFAEAVRIAAGTQTTGNVSIHAVQGTGGIDLRFLPSFNNPLVLSPTPAFGDVQVYVGQTTPFSIGADVAATFYWYLQGQYKGTGPTFDLASAGLIVNQAYRLDVLAFSTSGDRGASGTWTVACSEYSPAMVRIGGGVLTPSFGYNYAVTVQLIAADGVTPIGVVQSTNGLLAAGQATAYPPFNSLTVGATYFIRICAGAVPNFSGTDWSWWSPSQTKKQGAAPEAGRISIPQDGLQSYDFLMAFGG